VNRILTAISVLCGLITVLVACSKKIETEEPCRILEFTTYVKYQTDIKYDTITAKFNYDQNGNPISIIFNKTTTGRPNYHFKYDNDGKLIWMGGLWPSTSKFDYIYKFKYQGNTILSDSMFFSGSDTSDLFYRTYSLYLGNYSFDTRDRLIEYDYDIYFPSNPSYGPIHFNEKYAYDGNGNLIGNSGGVPYSYDNKINFLSLHPALQLLNRDFSVNNRVPAISYNKHGLPLVFDHTQPHPYNSAPFMSIGVNKIVYSCD